MQDRRQYPRFIPDSALLVSLNTSQRGLLSDLSERGMAVDAFLPETPNATIQLAFRLPDGGDTIEARGEVVWTNDSRRTGVRFVELADTTQQQLRQWLSVRVFRLGEDDDPEEPFQEQAVQHPSDVPPNLTRPESASESPEERKLQLVPGPQPRPNSERVSGTDHGLSRYHLRYPLGLAVGTIVLCSAAVLLGYYLPNLVHAPKLNPTTPIAEASATLPVKEFDASAGTVSETELGPEPQAPIGSAGFVLQVGAMRHRENADTLADKLREKSFPAFVVAREGDSFYRVDVGPYADAAYARSVKDELKGDGFDTVLERGFGGPSR